MCVYRRPSVQLQIKGLVDNTNTTIKTQQLNIKVLHGALWKPKIQLQIKSLANILI